MSGRKLPHGFRFRWVPALGAGLLALTANAQTVFTVSHALDSGAGSLRQAILNANSSPGRDTILFKIPGAGVHTLSLLSALPPVSEAAILDGGSQPGYAGLPLIELDGTAAGTGSHGLLLTGGNCVVRGLAINRWNGDGIRIEGPGGNLIHGNFIGTDPAGKVALGNASAGMEICQSSGNQIGGTNTNEGNLISGNKLSGVYIIGPDASANVLLGNRIGTDLTGKTRLGNLLNGIVISSASGNTIGGTGPGAGNVVSGNGQAGIYLLGASAADNCLLGNRIGTDLSGTTPLGNTEDGVMVLGTSGNHIGGGEPGGGNVISGNGGRGIFIVGAGALSNVVAGNFIGTDATGQAAVSNAFAGVALSGAVGNQIGGPAAAWGNVISGNGQSGIALTEGAFWTVIQANRIGTDASGTKPLGNRYHGVSIAGVSNLLGGTAAGLGNTISGNRYNGVYLAGPDSGNNLLQANRIGTDSSGRFALGNRLSGVLIENAPSNAIGGGFPNSGNLISGNAGNGVFLVGTNATGNAVQGNWIGTDVTGSTRIPNLAGVGLTNAPLNLIGGTNSGTRNLISGNNDSGIYLQGPAAATNRIEGNWIGPDWTGTNALGNLRGGIYLYASPGNYIGGIGPGTGNLISGNPKDGIALGDPGAVGNVVQGNFIGTQIDGVSPLGNQWHSIEILNYGSNNIIGGESRGAGNRIAYAQTSLYAGIRIRDACPGNVIRRNAIFANAGLGIDHGANGPNPAYAARLSPANGRYLTRVQGSLSGSQPNRAYTLDFFVNAAKDPTGYGEGERWLGSLSTVTDAAGKANFSAAFTNRTAALGFISATATDPVAGTAEFSLCVSNGFAPSADSDHDGLPDDYESAWTLDPANPADAARDPDHDGASNTQEFLAGTNPLDPSDAFGIISCQPAQNGLTLTFSTAPGQRYHVERVDSLNSEWIDCTASLPGTGWPLSVTDTNPAAARFYRVASP